MVEMLDIIGAAVKLAGGESQPNLKFALQIAALSPQKSIRANARGAEVLSHYVVSGLPAPESLHAGLVEHGTGMVTDRMLSALYWAERMDKAGWLDPYKRVPQGRAEWVAWRDGLRELLRGHGYGYKVISFAGLIYAPLECELVPIDRHVLARLGLTTRTGKERTASPQSRHLYLRIEDILIAERDQAGKSGVPLGLWHWLRWANWRELTGASELWGDAVTDHAALSCCNYRLTA